jgi:hypothetical protein
MASRQNWFWFKIGKPGSTTRLPRGESLHRLQGLAKALYLLLGASILVSLLSAFAHHRRAGLITSEIRNPWSVSQAKVEKADSAVQYSSLAVSVLGLAILAVFIVWAWRATKNLESWGAPLQRGPGWAVGGWFVPFANVFIGYQVVRDAWRLVPMSEETYPKPNKPWLFAWVTYVISQALTLFGLRLSGLELSLSDIRVVDRILETGDFIRIVAGIALIISVRQISARQDECATAAR